MRTLLISLSIFALLSAASPCRAEAGRPVYVVDMQKVIDESVAGKAARNNLEAEARKREAVLEKSNAELTRLRQDLEKQKTILSGQALDDKRDALEKKATEFDRLVQDQREDLRKRQDAEFAKVLKGISETVGEIAKEKGYQVVIERDRQFVLYVAPDFDLTESVIKLLDRKTIS